MFHSLGKLFGAKRTRAARPRVRLGMEALENRYAPSASPMSVPIASAVHSASQTPTAAASVNGESFSRTIQFSGLTWGVKDSGPDLTGPGNNYFSSSPKAVFVDNQGDLHLKVSFIDGQWRSSEVVLLNSTGYGTYTIQTAANLAALPSNVTAGFFTYDMSATDTNAPDPKREIDIEDGKFANGYDTNNSQFAVQPYATAGNTDRYALPDPSGNPSLTRAFRWESDQVDFYAAKGSHTPSQLAANNPVFRVADSATQTVVPILGDQTFRMNLWVYPGGAPANGQTVEIVVKSFSFTPLAATANHAPVMGTSLAILDPVKSNAGLPSGAVGTLVSSLVGRASITDTDAGAKKGIAVTAIDDSHGTWFYSTNDGATWLELPPADGTKSLLLAANAKSRVDFQADPGYSGIYTASSFTFRAWDRSSGKNGGTADAEIHGSESAFSDATALALVTIA